MLQDGGRDAELLGILARLQSELRRVDAGATAADAAPLAARPAAERLWGVAPGAATGRGLGLFVKRVVRRLTRWQLEPLAAQQRDFNLVVLRLVDELAARVAALEQRAARPQQEPGDEQAGR